MDPLVTVIIPAYNAEQFIEKSINSVLKQHYQNVEIIVVDDRSTDNTVFLVNSLQHHSHRIVCIQNVREKGPSGARNTALNQARGDYIAFLDADDVWLPDHLQKAVKFLETYDADAVFFNFTVVENKDEKTIGDWFSLRKFIRILKAEQINDEFWLVKNGMFTALIQESFIHLQTLVLRRAICEGIFFDERVMRSEDRDFVLKLYFEAEAQFAYSWSVTGVYYRHSNSLTTSDIDKSILLERDRIILFREYINKYVENDYSKREIERILTRSYITLSYYYRLKHNFKMALVCLYKSCEHGINIYQFRELLKICAASAFSVLSKPTNVA